MDLSRSQAGAARMAHVMAIPYPGRGHINPMMNFCKLLASTATDVLVTTKVMEEWLGISPTIGFEPKPDAVQFAPIPNVIPSKRDRAENFPMFIEAVMTKMEAPVEQLLDRLEPLVTTILADTYLFWAVRIRNKRKIQVGSFWTMSVLVFSVFHHFDLLAQNNHFPIDLAKRGDELEDYIPGLPPTRLVDLPTFFEGKGRATLDRALECFSWMLKAQYIILTTFHKLEARTVDALKAELPLPIYTWLDAQPEASVLYFSLGSFLSVSSDQMEELTTGVRNSGVRFLFCGKRGLVVPWCDQLKVLNHFVVGGFWTHCRLNSTLEAIFASVPMLAFLIFDLPIVEIVQRFMDLDSEDGKAIRKMASELQ
ncbi:hypothetical protein ACJRO7_004821 [Eucalyptus globulus]|uniref:Uncharacterized protein n=1 Tax=Eucalyptus globulus TaxID=34317 RepID=A0ABD3J304_EUCGL